MEVRFTIHINKFFDANILFNINTTKTELICETEFLSVDPYMRIYMSRLPSIPAPMIGTQVAKYVKQYFMTHKKIP